MTGTKIHVPSSYKKAAKEGDNAGTQKYDYALVELSSPIGSTLGYFALGGYNTTYTIDTLVGQKAIVVGYPGNSGSKMYRHKSDIVGYNSGEYIIHYTTDTTGGQSGSPVFLYTGTGAKYYVVAIHTGGGKYV